jgi:uncharacterized protein (DUF952 family)
MGLICHIADQQEWAKALTEGAYTTASLQEEGFIHASDPSQVEASFQRYYAGQTGLVKLVIDTEKLTSQLIYEWSPSTEATFPHIYGPINLDAVIEVIPY